MGVLLSAHVKESTGKALLKKAIRRFWTTSNKICAGIYWDTQDRDGNLYMKNLLSCGILLFLLPVLVVILCNGCTAVWGDDRAQDTALSVLLYQNSPPDAPAEALKAEAVVFRTVLKRYSAAQWNDVLRTSVEVVQEKAYQEKEALYAQAIRATKDIQAVWGEEPVYLPYHSVSAGKTRQGEMALPKDLTDRTATEGTKAEMAAITAVDSPWDREAAGYQQVFSFTEEYLQHKAFGADRASGEIIHIQDIQTDSAGYVQYIQTAQSLLTGDEIRELLGLSSPCFTIQRKEERWIFTCLGIGHGYGMSLYGCAAMAEEGKSCLTILQYYYPQYTFHFLN